MTPEDRYRALWYAWLNSKVDFVREHIEKQMDACQVQIALSPKDPKWLDFLKTMPQSYHDHWDRTAYVQHRVNNPETVGPAQMRAYIKEPGRPN